MNYWIAVFLSEVTGLEELCDHGVARYQGYLQPVIQYWCLVVVGG